MRSIVGLLLAVSPMAAGAEGVVPELRISVRDEGIYRISYEALVEAGLPPRSLDSGGIGLSNRGRPVPVWVADGGDGTFDPGDGLEFLGEILPGENAPLNEHYFNQHSLLNVYRLSWDGSALRRLQGAAVPVTPRDGVAPRRLWRLRHLEENRLMIRLHRRHYQGSAAPETWFWAKLTHLAKPLAVPIDLAGLDPAAADQVSLRLHFRALTDHRGDLPDHRVEVSVGGSRIGVAEWDGKTAYLMEIPEPGAVFNDGVNKLEIDVPRRIPPGESDPLVDVVMLDWIEVRYPHRGRIGQEQLRLDTEPAAAAGLVELSSPGAAELVAYSRRRRIEASPGAGRLRFEPADGEAPFHLVSDHRFKVPEQIEADRPSNLRDTSRQADYLMIAHRRLLDAVRPLADFHRRRGLAVELIDVQDLYDEFNHGILHPRAIRDFIAHAYHRWEKPAPRFALLVGDASWDLYNTEISDGDYANRSGDPEAHRRFSWWPMPVVGYGPESLTGHQRNLVPTWPYPTPEGQSASDNDFATVDGDDHLPDLAVGRLPVVEPHEVAGIVAKTIRYAERPEVGPWRRNVLWITSDLAYAQRFSDRLAEETAQHGFASAKVYPGLRETSYERHQARLRDAFDQGQLLVHFYGHGGRYIWRTAPADFKTNEDLFTLDDLERLKPNRRLPIVVSMTCFSAPFDHPDADSIGEKFLRLPDRGAVAVIAASWRNHPNRWFSRQLVHELTRPGTIGEAVLRAKRTSGHREMVALYNLLGDPAAPIAVPRLKVRVDAAVGPDSRPSVVSTVEADGFKGRARVEWLNATGEVVRSSTKAVRESRFKTVFKGGPTEAATVRAVRVYVWNRSRGLDGIGRLDWPAPAPSAAASP